MTDKDIMKLIIKLFEAEAKRLSLLEKDRKICKVKETFFWEKGGFVCSRCKEENC